MKGKEIELGDIVIINESYSRKLIGKLGLVVDIEEHWIIKVLVFDTDEIHETARYKLIKQGKTL